LKSLTIDLTAQNNFVHTVNQNI